VPPIYAAGIASSHQAHATASGCFINDDMLANVCKHHVTKLPFELGRIAQAPDDPDGYFARVFAIPEQR
jgi:aromatic ring hydroxylase